MNRWSCNVTGSAGNSGTNPLEPKANPFEHTAVSGDVFRTRGTDRPYDRPGYPFVLDTTGLEGIEICDWDGYDRPMFTHTGAGVGYGTCIRLGGGGPGRNVVRRVEMRDTIEGGIGGGGAGVNVLIDDVGFSNIGVTQTSIVTGAAICFGASNAVESLIVRRHRIDGAGWPGVFGNVIGTYEVAFGLVKRVGLAGSPLHNSGDCVEAGIAPAIYHVHHNVLDHSDKDSKQAVQQSGPGSEDENKLAIIEHNTLLGPVGTGAGISHKTIYLQMRALVQYNRIVTGGFAVQLKGGGDIIGNGIMINGVGAHGSNQGPIHSENVNKTLTRILHNTIIRVADASGAHSAISVYDGEDAEIHNNVVEGFEVGIRAHAKAVRESYNCIRGTKTPVTDQYLNPRAVGAGTITESPMIGYDFMPALISPCIGAGLRIPGLFDLEGVPFMDAPTMGCREVLRRLEWPGRFRSRR